MRLLGCLGKGRCRLLQRLSQGITVGHGVACFLEPIGGEFTKALCACGRFAASPSRQPLGEQDPAQQFGQEEGPEAPPQSAGAQPDRAE